MRTSRLARLAAAATAGALLLTGCTASTGEENPTSAAPAVTQEPTLSPEEQAEADAVALAATLKHGDKVPAGVLDQHMPDGLHRYRMDRLEVGTYYALAVDQPFPEPVRADLQARVDFVMDQPGREVDKRLISVMEDSGRKPVFVVQRLGKHLADERTGVGDYWYWTVTGAVGNVDYTTTDGSYEWAIEAAEAAAAAGNNPAEYEIIIQSNPVS